MVEFKTLNFFIGLYYMGILIKDMITLESGLEVSNVYASIGSGRPIIVTKVSHNPKTYQVRSKISVWVNRQKSLEADTRSILKSYSVLVNNDDIPPNENIYELLYTQFKNAYGLTCEDVIE